VGEYWIAPNAILIGRVRLLKGASIHADPGMPVVLGLNVSIGHGVVLHGAIVGDNTIIGMGATLLNRAKIGKKSIVDAHALVPEGKEYPDNSLLIGVPAKVVPSIPEEQTGMLRLNAQIYFDRWQRYRQDLTEV
jgi:carbonic anhydrase/acetyltransferase-like protein (isoleucine patch superfamily)